MYTSQGVLPIKAYLKNISKALLFNLKEKMNLVFILFNGSGEKRVKIFTEPTLKIINKTTDFRAESRVYTAVPECCAEYVQI